MKFSDGNWLMMKGVHASYATQAYDIETSPSSITIYATCSHIQNRGQTLGGPLVTVKLTSPADDIIRVQAQHLTGETGKPLSFPLELGSDIDVDIVSSDDSIRLTSGGLSARVAKGSQWEIAFQANQKTLTKSGFRALGVMEVDGDGSYIHEQLSLGVGELVYGLGEHFTSFVKNGQVVEMWNKDGGTGSDQAYKNVPFYLTNKGYGVFVNQTEAVSFETASEKVSRVQFSVPGQSLDYFIIYGPTPKEILEKYTALTGKPALPPTWSFGLWLTTSFTTNYNEETVTSFIQGMKDRGLPLHVFHFDCFWMKEFHWCDFTWDERTFPDPVGMLQRLKAHGLKICVWINPYIAQRSPLFEEGKQAGYLITRPDGSVWQTDLWQPGMAIVDFTNPAACTWFNSKLKALLDMGVDSFKTDFGERIPTDVVYHDGSDPVKMHNFYSYLYNETVFNLLTEVRGEGEALLFARSGTAGCQKFPVHWGGDCNSNYESMAESLRGGLSLCLSGFGFWSHDIGGFEGTPPADIYKRWIAFGLLSTHSRLHGSHSYRVPWQYDDEAVDVLRYFTKLKCSLMPTLYASAVEAHQDGIPMMRAMMLEFPNDPASDYLDRQYMLGPSLLVAPVFSKENAVDYYLPEGRWTDFVTGKPVEGQRWVRQECDFLSVPLLVRPNSIIAVGSRNDIPNYDFSDGVTLKIYELSEDKPASIAVPDQKGKTALTATAKCRDQKIEVQVCSDHTNWKVVLVGVTSYDKVCGGSAETTEEGLLITATSDQFTVHLLG